MAANASSFLNFVGGGHSDPPPQRPAPAPERTVGTSNARDFLGFAGGAAAPPPRQPPAAPTTSSDDALSRDLKKANADKLALSNEVDRLREENRQLLARAGDGRGAAAERERADGLNAEVVRLRDYIAAEKRNIESELQRRTASISAEVDRRVYEAQTEERRRIEAQYEDKMSRLRSEFDRLLDENRRLERELNDAQRTPAATPSGGTLDLSDLFPLGVELSSLKRSEWRRLFEQLVAELARRKKSHRAVDSVHDVRRSKYNDSHDDVRRRVEELWKKDYAPAYMPPPPPRRDADDFLRWGAAPKRNDADDFLSWSGAPKRSDADAFLAFGGGGGGGGGGKTADDFLRFGKGGGGDGGMSASSTNDFLKFAAGGSGGGGSLANDAGAFLSFVGK